MSGTWTLPFRRRLLSTVFLDEPLGFTDFQLCLTRRVPAANADLSQLDEPTGMGYSRQQFSVGSANWQLSAAGEVVNKGLLYFSTATGTWGVMTGWALISVEATPMVCAVGTLAEPYRVVAGIQPYVPVGGLAVGLYD